MIGGMRVRYLSYCTQLISWILSLVCLATTLDQKYVFETGRSINVRMEWKSRRRRHTMNTTSFSRSVAGWLSSQLFNRWTGRHNHLSIHPTKINKQRKKPESARNWQNQRVKRLFAISSLRSSLIRRRQPRTLHASPCATPARATSLNLYRYMCYLRASLTVSISITIFEIWKSS